MTSFVAEDVRSSDVGARTKSKATFPRKRAVSMVYVPLWPMNGPAQARLFSMMAHP